MLFKKLLLVLSVVSCTSTHAYTLDMARDLPILGALINKMSPKPPRIVRFAHVLIAGDIESSALGSQYIFSVSQKGDRDGILFVIDSPGGSPTHSQIIAEAIARVAQLKPCISYVSLAASGGYLLAASTPYIMAASGAAVGNVGALMYFERDKDKDTVMLSGEYFKFPRFAPEGAHLVPEHEAFYAKNVAQTGEWFRDILVHFRPVLTVQALYDTQGKIFHAQDALELKLIDAIGTVKDAVAELYKRAGSPACESVELVHENGEVMARYTPQELV